jgi:hypothetical protein
MDHGFLLTVWLIAPVSLVTKSLNRLNNSVGPVSVERTTL